MAPKNNQKKYDTLKKKLRMVYLKIRISISEDGDWRIKQDTNFINLKTFEKLGIFFIRHWKLTKYYKLLFEIEKYLGPIITRELEMYQRDIGIHFQIWDT